MPAGAGELMTLLRKTHDLDGVSEQGKFASVAHYDLYVH